jgi:hypothetical protein
MCGGVAMLLAQTCRQPFCFHGQAAQAPFVFDSVPRGCFLVLLCNCGRTRLFSCVRTRRRSCTKSHSARQERRWLYTDRHTHCAGGQLSKHARTQRTGASCSVEDVRQQTHIRPATLDSMCWSAASLWVCKGSGHKRAAFGREYASTTGRPPGIQLETTVNQKASPAHIRVVKGGAVKPRLRVQEHEWRAS